MKILLPVDGSEFTKRMLAYIAAHDDLLGPGHEYLAITAVPEIPHGAARFLERGTLDDYYRDHAEDVMHPVRAFAAQNRWNLKTEFRAGPAAEVISQAAKDAKVDLIVMGSHGHSAFGNVVLGSVATGVLARCKLPVLLVR